MLPQEGKLALYTDTEDGRGKKSQDVGDARMAMGNKLVQQSQAEFLLNKINKNIFKEALEINTSNTNGQEKHILGRKELLWQCLFNTQSTCCTVCELKRMAMQGEGGRRGEGRSLL